MFTTHNKDITPIYSSTLRERKKQARLNKLINCSTFKSYKTLVWIYTKINCVSLKDIHKRGFKTYHIDHKISITDGYKNNICPSKVAHLSNLRIISHKDNLLKNTDSFVDEHNYWLFNET